MNKLKKIIPLIKDNFKAMIFSGVYILLFYLSLGAALTIGSPDGMLKLPLFLSSFAALISFLGIISRYALVHIFKEECETVIRGVYIILAVALFLGITGILRSFIFAAPFPYVRGLNFDGANFSGLWNIFMIPVYILGITVLAVILIALSLLAYIFLRLAIRYTKPIYYLNAVCTVITGFLIVYYYLLH